MRDSLKFNLLNIFGSNRNMLIEIERAFATDNKEVLISYIKAAIKYFNNELNDLYIDDIPIVEEIKD